MSDVRTHRPFSPNRRPLLISALLVALTSVPTMVVGGVGSATLDGAPPSRAPIVAEPRPGPVVIDSSPSSGLHPSSGVPDRHSVAAVPTAPKPPVRPRTTARASGGTGGGFSVGTGTKAPAAPPVEASPPAAAAPAPGPSPSSDVPIQDRAWPGWDGQLKGKSETARLDTADRRHPHRHPARWRRSPSGSVDRSDPADRSPVSYLPARVLELRVTMAQAVENGLQGH